MNLEEQNGMISDSAGAGNRSDTFPVGVFRSECNFIHFLMHAVNIGPIHPEKIAVPPIVVTIEGTAIFSGWIASIDDLLAALKNV